MSNEQKAAEGAAPTLRRTLGFWQVTAGSVGGSRGGRAVSHSGPGNRLPLLAVLGIASVTLMLTQLERDAILLGLSLCALGLGSDRVESRRRAAPGTGGST